MPWLVSPSTDKIYQEDLPKVFFQSILQEKQRAAPFLEPNVLNFLSAKIWQESNA